MSWRQLIISRRCKLDYQMGYLVVRGEEVTKIHLDEIAVLMLENPAVSLTGCLMEALTEKKIKVIFCDSKRSPVAEVVPYHGSHDSSEKIRKQCAWAPEMRAIVWQAIIQEKILQQAIFLEELGHDNEAILLRRYITQVEPYDATNREGHAAKVYFNAVFGMDFSRRTDTPINAALNYGYSILLSAFNRELAFHGYLTQIGLFHDNMFNHFNLSCDLMEPFRILVDRAVVELNPEGFDREEKHALWQVLSKRVRWAEREQLVSSVIRLYTINMMDCMTSQDVSKIRFYENI